jgi:pSer/pThr/pTyr-binding forkhead associated (FHA) protein
MQLQLTVSHAGDDGSRTGSYGYSFDKDEVLVGRDPATDVQLPHPAVSLVHLRLLRDEDRWRVVDEDSTNGTFVDGRRLAPDEEAPLAEGCVVRVGPFELLVGDPRPDGAETAPEDTARFARQMVLEILGAFDEQQRPSLEVLDGPQRGQALRLPAGGAAVIGRGEETDLRLSDGDASRRHLEVTCEGGAVLVRDLGSKNGTELNGRPLEERRSLAHDDVLQIGETGRRFDDPAADYLGDLQREDYPAPLAPTPEPEPEPAPAPATRRSDWPIWVLAAVVILGAAGVVLYLLLW